MNGLLLLTIALAYFAAGYAFYGGYLNRLFGIDDRRSTPSETKNDGVDYVPTSRVVLFGHHFSSIAGAGPIVGPIAAAYFGWLPALPGANWARRVHMLCSYWLFVLAFVHAGLHIHVPRDVPEAKLRVARLVLAAVSCYGAYSFVRLGMLPYLLGQVQFAAADYEAPLVLGFARYTSVGMLIACLAHCLRAALQRRAKKSGSKAS